MKKNLQFTDNYLIVIFMSNSEKSFFEKQARYKQEKEAKIEWLNQYYVNKEWKNVISPYTNNPMTIFEALVENNKKEEDTVIRAQNFLWQVLFVLCGKDKTTPRWSDVKLQYGYPPAFDRKGWVKDNRFGIIDEELLEKIHDYLTPQMYKEDIILKLKDGDETIDYDYSWTLNYNIHYEKPEPGKPENKKQMHFTVSRDFDEGYSLDRFRINLAWVSWRKMWTMRTIDSKIPRFEDLNLPQQVKQFAEISKGLFLVVWPTGSGKTTTLASIVDIINRNQNRNIITIEDPIEYVYVNNKSFISQREVHKDTKSFAAGTRAALREKPDIVYIWEMRDLETTRAALELAETGHLAIATLHTFNAAKTVDRIIQQFPVDEQNTIRQSLASALIGIVSQTLVPTYPDANGNIGKTPLNEVVLFNQAARINVSEWKSIQIKQSVSWDPRSLTMAEHAKMISIDNKRVDPHELLTRFYYNDHATYEEYKTLLEKAGMYNTDIDPAKAQERQQEAIKLATAEGRDVNEAMREFEAKEKERLLNRDNSVNVG